MHRNAEGIVLLVGVLLVLGEVVHRFVTGGAPSAWAIGPATMLIFGGLFAGYIPTVGRKGK